MKPAGILETVIYAEDLAAARHFYETVLGLSCLVQHDDRHVFFRMADQMLLVFNPRQTEIPQDPAPGVAPSHGAHGPGHVCFRAGANEITKWRTHFEKLGIAIDADFEWKSGGRSLYVRDPAGNSVEFAEPRIWGLPETRRTLRGEKIVVATHNKGKLEEFRALFAPYGVKAVSAGELGLPEPAETETSFEGNARIKARAAMEASGLITLADDSGLCVDALEGAPGVYTADWAGPERDWSMAMRLVEEKLEAKGATRPEQRHATFNCTLCVLFPDGEERFYVGQAPGHLTWPPRGTLGHGYDPMFVPQGETRTFAELDPEHKNRISHRARALQKLFDDLF
jgi:XTP/dITP diphosphohydrolase